MESENRTALFIKRLLTMSEDWKDECRKRDIEEWIKSECEPRCFDMDEVSKTLKDLLHDSR